MTIKWIKHYMQGFDQDDVFQNQFLHSTISRVDCDNSSLGPEARAHLTSLGMRSFQRVKSSTLAKLSPGPYVISDGHLLKPFRLYHDHNSAFFSATR